MATEAQLASTALVPIVQGLTQRAPGCDISEPQLSGRDRKAAADSRCHHPDRAAHDQARRCALASRGSSLHMARRPKELFQVIVGARQARDLVALEEAIPITFSDFPEMRHCGSERPQLILLLCHDLEQLLIVLL